MMLFPDEPPPVEGLKHISDYFPEAACSALLDIIDRQLWITDLKRRVQHYGYKYDYRARPVDPAHALGPLPDKLQEISQRLFEERLFESPPDQAIVNEYLPGQGIAPHVDCVPCFGPVIASLSLTGICEMTFTGPDGDKHTLILEPSSLLVLSGPARYVYRHAIPARKSDVLYGVRRSRERRISLTFRTVIANGN